MRDYYGPLSPSLVWRLEADIPFSSGGSDVYRVFGQPGDSTLDWNEPPVTLGAMAPYTDVYQAQPGQFLDYCAGCRQGDTFYPVFNLVNGASPGEDMGDKVGFAPGSIHLYDQAGQELPPTTFRNVATYQLPAQQARYKLVIPDDNITWDFTSATPATDQTPPGTGCVGTVFGVSTAPCQADPLVFLRYDAGLSLANTITPGVHQLQVTGYHQDPSAPPVTSLKLWTSTDGGSTWQQARLSGGRDGTWTAAYALPQLSQTNGYLSIKATAADSAGNDITQTIVDAVKLAAG
jgi:hypothetical protein